MDVSQIEESLARIEEGLADARLAVEQLRDGDATAISELDSVVDEMARELAALKGRTSGGIG